jgi:hypothetical protein
MSKTSKSEVSVAVDWDLRPGDALLGVELLELVARGRGGAVWRARDADGHVVALKMFDGQGDTPDAEAFRSGVAALNWLCVEDARGTVRIPRLVTVELDRLAVVEEYVPNGDARAIPSLSWDAGRIVEFFLALCRNVSALHDIGMIHGALKPSNVLVDENLAPMLSDPRKIHQLGRDSAIQVIDAIYRAPEKHNGAFPEHPATDVYSLGQILTFLLASGEVAGTPDAVRALRARKTVPPGLVRIVRKATAVDPQIRYQSVGEFVRELERYHVSDSVGLSSKAPAPREHVIDVASLQPQPPRLPAPRVPVQSDVSVTRRSRYPSRRIERRVGLAGVVAAVLATLLLAATPLPSSEAAAVYGGALTASLALATFLVPRYPPNPLLQRAALLLGAVLIHALANPGALAMLRWKHTLRKGTTAERATAATLLVKSGFFNLAGANLRRARLVRAHLGEANLTNANLFDADLTEASLAEANLEGSNVRKANLSGADLYGSNIERAAGFRSTYCDRQTIMPARWACVDGRPRPTD